MVTDVNEAPDIPNRRCCNNDRRERTPIDVRLGGVGNTYMANDPETTDEPTLALTGADKGKFNFTVDGRLTFKAPPPDYETPGDANEDNVYEVTVQAKDGVGNIGMKTVKVTVTNMDEVGTVTMSQLQPRVGVAITAGVTDLDGDVSGVTWQWSRGISEATGDRLYRHRKGHIGHLQAGCGRRRGGGGHRR